MRKIAAIMFSIILVITLCSACSDSSGDGAADRATLGSISFEVPEGLAQDNEVYSNDAAEDHLAYIGENAIDGNKMLHIEYCAYEGDVIPILGGELEPRHELTVSNEVCGDVDIVYGAATAALEADAFHEAADLFENEATCCFVVDDKEYTIGIEISYQNEEERNKNQEKDFDYEIETIKSMLQSVEKTDQ